MKSCSMRGFLLEEEGRRSGQHNAHGDDHEAPRVGDSRAFNTVRGDCIAMPLWIDDWLPLRRFEIEVDGILVF